MPTWYTATLAFSVFAALVLMLFRHTYRQSKGLEPPTAMDWDGPESAVMLLGLCLVFLLVPPARWIGASGAVWPLLFVIRAMVRGAKLSALPTFPTNPKETSWKQ